MEEWSLPTTPQPRPIITSSPLGEVKGTLECKAVPLMIEKQLDFTVLESSGIDVILEMDWMVKHKGLVSCNPRFVRLEHPSRVQVQFEPSYPKTAPMLCSLDSKTLEEVPMVCEFPDVFPEELIELPPDRDV